jgi:translation initiation factor eIF-2B subunit epsilon
MGKKEKVVGGKKGESGGGGEDSKRDQKLQAILLADSFSKSFRPITWEKPKVLLPLVNVPMIEYTIEFLAQNGVEEVITNLASFEVPLSMRLDRISCFVFDR